MNEDDINDLEHPASDERTTLVRQIDMNELEENALRALDVTEANSELEQAIKNLQIARAARDAHVPVEELDAAVTNAERALIAAALGAETTQPETVTPVPNGEAPPTAWNFGA